LGREQPEEVELLCSDCHALTDEARATTSHTNRDEPQEGMIVGVDGDHWGKLDPDTIYLPLQDGRYVPVQPKQKGKS
jgi:hypothetical protein